MANAVMSDWPSGVANTGWPSEPTAMLMPGRVQGWPAGTQRAANAAQRLLSQAVAWWDVEQYRDGARFLRNRGTGGELLDLRLGSAAVANSNEPLYLPSLDQGYVALPGVAGNYLSVPDEAALDAADDLDIRILCSLDDWTPSATSTLISKRNVTTQISWTLEIIATGVVRFRPSITGTVSLTYDSTSATGIADGDARWVRVTRNKAAGEIKFWLSTDGTSWTQLGSTVTGATTDSLFVSTSNVEIGAYGLGTTSPAAGRFFRAVIYADLTETNKVLDIDCDAITSGSATSFTAVTNQTVTVNRSTTGRKSVAMPSRHKGGKPVMLFGTDDYLEVQDNWQHGLLNFGQGDSFTVLAVARRWATQATNSIIAKRADIADASPGWLLLGITSDIARVYLSDGTTALTYSNSNYTSGPVTPIAVVKEASRASVNVKGVAGTAAADTTASKVNQMPLRIGRYSGSGATAYLDGEFYAAAIWRRALTPAEITTLSNYFTGRIA